MKTKNEYQTDHKPLKYLFSPDEEIPKTSSAIITRWAKALMGFDYELKHTPREQIPGADALRRMDFDVDEFDNGRVFFAINNVHFAQSDLVTQAEIKTKNGTNRLFQDIMKRIKCGQLETMLRRGKRFPTTEKCTAYTQWNHLQRSCSFHSSQITTYDTWFWQKLMRHLQGKCN